MFSRCIRYEGELGGDGIFCGPVRFICELQCVQIRREEQFDVIHCKPLKIFHGCGGQGYQAVVVHGGQIWLLVQRYYGGTFYVGGHSGSAPPSVV